MKDSSFSLLDKFFLSMLIGMVSMGWVFVVFNPPPNADLGYYILIYGPLGWMITAWLLVVWGMIIYCLFTKQLTQSPITHYRVDDEYDLYLKEAYKEIDDFLKETT
jgi:hypothetical protein